jgi:hypothetical protein
VAIRHFSLQRVRLTLLVDLATGLGKSQYQSSFSR